MRTTLALVLFSFILSSLALAVPKNVEFHSPTTCNADAEDCQPLWDAWGLRFHLDSARNYFKGSFLSAPASKKPINEGQHIYDVDAEMDKRFYWHKHHYDTNAKLAIPVILSAKAPPSSPQPVRVVQSPAPSARPVVTAVAAVVPAPSLIEPSETPEDEEESYVIRFTAGKQLVVGANLGGKLRRARNNAREAKRRNAKEAVYIQRERKARGQLGHGGLEFKDALGEF